jgi:hypothetical protein
MDDALLDGSLSFEAFLFIRDRFLAERAAEAALVRQARTADRVRRDPPVPRQPADLRRGERPERLAL